MRCNVQKVIRVFILYGFCFLIVNYVYHSASVFQWNEKSETPYTKTSTLGKSFDKQNKTIGAKASQDLQERAVNSRSKRNDGNKHTLKPNKTQVPSVSTKDKWRNTQLQDIYITVKTSKTFHQSRIKLLLDTWWMFAKDQTYFFTDSYDPELIKKTRGHVINTNCTEGHSRDALCCKMSVEFDYYIISNKRWFCHVDDDTYINIPMLLQVLQKYNHTEAWYLGKPSLNHPIEIQNFRDKNGPRVSFWFATGGAGFCISRPLALEMVRYAGGGRLKTQCSKIRLPDDCAIGFVIEYYLNKKLTVINEFHSHLEGLWMLKSDQLSKQISLSYSGNGANLVQVPGFSKTKDPTRILSIHCLLNPYLEQCPRDKDGNIPKR